MSDATQTSRRGAVRALGLTIAAAAASGAAACAQEDGVFIDRGVEGHWLTEDGAAIVEITACGPRSSAVCGSIRALPNIESDPEIAAHAPELCGLTLLYNLTHEAGGRWTGGQVLDPETERLYDVSARVDRGLLRLHVSEGIAALGESIIWTPAEPSRGGCEPTPPAGN